jgi:large subunit ribosomal protein L24
MNTLNLKKNDVVVVIKGKDRGKTGKILKVIPEKNRVVVENVNSRRDHGKRSSHPSVQLETFLF